MTRQNQQNKMEKIVPQGQIEITHYGLQPGIFAYIPRSGVYPAILGKGPWPKLENKMIDLKSKLGKINDIKHINGSKIYSQPSFSRIVNFSFDVANTI